MEHDNNINVINYNLYLKIDINKLRLIGKTLISVEILKKTTKIIINSKNLFIKKLLINDEAINFYEDKKSETLNIDGNFEESLIKIYIEYEHCIGMDMDGLYYVKQNNSIIFSTQLEPIYARKVFPCFDMPHLKSTFDITLESNKDKIFLSNMNPISTLVSGENKIVKFETTPLMSTYLVCVVVGDIKKSTPVIVRDKLYVNGYYFAESADLLKTSIQITALSIKYYEKIFGIEYKLPKMDIIAIPNFLSGAMENWGLVTFRESGLMTDKIKNIAWIISSIEVIFHEISHQWFGNLVTLNSWKDIWLNEATATYFSWIGLVDNYEHLYPLQWYYLSTFRSAMLMDGFESTHPISTEIKSSNDVIQYFDEISYSKGSCLINYISEFMSRNNFMKAIASYLKKYSWQTAKPENLYQILDNFSPKNTESVSQLMKKFVLVKGYPLLTVTKYGDNYKIRKNKFLFIKSDKEEEYNIDFPLKIKYIKNKKKYEEIIQIENSVVLTNEPILNVENMCLCIINYDNFLPNIELMSIQELMHQFDSAYYLSLSGYKNFNYLFAFVTEIFKKINFIKDLQKNMCLCHLIIKNLINLNYIIKSSNTQNTIFAKSYYHFISNIKTKIKNILVYCVNNKQNDMVTISLVSNLIEFLVEFNDKNVIELCKKIFERSYLNNESSNFNIFPLHEILFKTVIMYFCEEKIFHKINKIKTTTEDVFIRNSATWALAYSTQISEINNIMENLFDLIKLQDVSSFISHLSKNSLVQPKIINWVFNNVKQNPNISYKNFAHIVERLTPNIYDLNLLQILKNLYMKENDPSVFAIELDKINWHINIVNNIKSWTENYETIKLSK
jgi:hypothetical protein